MKNFKITHCGKDYFVKANDSAAAVEKVKIAKSKDAKTVHQISWDEKAIYGTVYGDIDMAAQHNEKLYIENLQGRGSWVSASAIKKAIASGKAKINDSVITDAEDYVIFKENGDIKGTLLSNYNARIRNANQVTNFSKQGFKSTKEAKEYMEKYGKGAKIVVKDDSGWKRIIQQKHPDCDIFGKDISCPDEDTMDDVEMMLSNMMIKFERNTNRGYGDYVVRVKDEISKSIHDIKPDYVDGDWELIAQGGSGSPTKGIFYKGKYIKSVRGMREAKAELNALKQGKNDPAFEKVKRSLSEQSKSKSSWKLRRVLHRNIPREANLAEREGIVWGVSARNEAYEYVDEYGFLHVLPEKL